MSEIPVQVIVAAFTAPDGAEKVMADIKLGKKAGLIGIQDAAVVVKDAGGNLKITDAKRRSRRRRGFITGGVIGGVLGLIAGPVGWMAVGGGALGALAGKVAGGPLRSAMESIGEALTPESSAIVAVIEHTWMARLEAELAAEGARVIHEALKADIAAQLNAGGHVLYTAIGGADTHGVARVAETPEGISASGVLVTEEGVFVGDAQLTDETGEE